MQGMFGQGKHMLNFTGLAKPWQVVYGGVQLPFADDSFNTAFYKQKDIYQCFGKHKILDII